MTKAAMSAQQITGEIQIDDIKRLYVDAVVKKDCPKCGSHCEHDFNEQYISYGDLDNIWFYCDNCDNEWEQPARIVSVELTIEVDDV